MSLQITATKISIFGSFNPNAVALSRSNIHDDHIILSV